MSSGKKSGGYIHAVAKARGLTVYGLAKHLGMSLSTAYAWDEEPERIPLGQAYKLKEFAEWSDKQWLENLLKYVS